MSTSGTADQQLTWRIRSGEWRVVLMNADGSSGVSADVKVGGRINHALAASLGVTGGGLIVLLLGVAVIAAGRRGERRPAVAATA